MKRLALAGALAIAACESGGAAVAGLDVTTPIELDPRPEGCARCHADIVEAWRASMHARAWDDPVFRREYEAAPHVSCRDCHAPATSAPGRSTGIDCATCHVREGVVLATSVSEAGARAHAMKIEPRLRTPEHCGDCHQFRFRDDGVHDPDEALQNTLAEHLQSDASARGQTCHTCHMPSDHDGVASHAFPGIHDRERLATAVAVEVSAERRAAGIEVHVRVTGAAIGHAFPTGDVFRRAVLRVTTESGASDELVMQRWLARTTDPDGEALHVRTVDDTRVPPPGQGELVDTMWLADTRAEDVEWTLVLHRLPPWRAAAAGLAPDIVQRTVQRGMVTVHVPP